MLVKTFLIGALVLVGGCAAGEPEGVLMPRSMAERANYYLISVTPDGEYERTLHSRVSSQSHGYSVTLIDCKTLRYKDLGYGEDDQSNIKMYDETDWVELIQGSSKYDLVTFVCAKG